MLPAPGKPTPVARCKPCGWDFYVSVGFGSTGWHIVPLKCRCRRHYFVVVHVTLEEGLGVRIAGLRQMKVAGATGVRRALTEEPIDGMPGPAVEMIVASAALLARGGSA